MIQQELIALVRDSAKARNEPPVPRQYIIEALRRIETEQEKVMHYPTGAPSLKAVYDIATRLESESVVEN